MYIKDITIGQTIKFGIHVRTGIKNIKGEVIAINVNHFTLQQARYRESYQYKDIITEVIAI